MGFRDFTDEEEKLWTIQLEKLLIEAKYFTELTNTFQFELECIVKEMDEHKSIVNMPKNGFHYIDVHGLIRSVLLGPILVIVISDIGTQNIF